MYPGHPWIEMCRLVEICICIFYSLFFKVYICIASREYLSTKWVALNGWCMVRFRASYSIYNLNSFLLRVPSYQRYCFFLDLTLCNHDQVDVNTSEKPSNPPFGAFSTCGPSCTGAGGFGLGLIHGS